MSVVVTSYMNGEEVESIVPYTPGKRTLYVYGNIIRNLINAGYQQIQIGNGAFLTDGEMAYKVEMV